MIRPDFARIGLNVFLVVFFLTTNTIALPQAQAGDFKPDEARHIAAEAYIYTYPFAVAISVWRASTSLLDRSRNIT